MKPVNRLVPILSSAAALLGIGLFVFATKPWLGLAGNDETLVAVVEAKRESRPIDFFMTGELQPASEIDVVSRVAGRLTDVKFKTGDIVSAGAIVATVYSGELTERVRLVEAELSGARTQLQGREQQAAEADKRFAYLKELYRQDLIARRDVEQAEIQVATARAELDLVRAQIAQSEAMLAQTGKLRQLGTIVAPISGVVTGTLSAGMSVNEARAILTIAQIDSLKLVGAVPARFSKLIHEGMTAQVLPREAPPQAINGTVIRMDRSGKIPGAEMPIEIRLDNHDGALRLGATVTATLTLKTQEPLLTIPRSALQSAADQLYVYQIVNGRAARRRVELDAPNTDPAVIRAGLKAGDLIIAHHLSAIREGLHVRALAPPQ